MLKSIQKYVELCAVSGVRSDTLACTSRVQGRITLQCCMCESTISRIIGPTGRQTILKNSPRNKHLCSAISTIYYIYIPEESKHYTYWLLKLFPILMKFTLLTNLLYNVLSSSSTTKIFPRMVYR